jgi:hypothetical protein
MEQKGPKQEIYTTMNEQEGITFHEANMQLKDV